MNALIIQHEDSTPPGSTLQWLELRGYNYKVISFAKGHCENIDDFNLLFILGGSMDVDQENEHNWLIEEKKFITNALKNPTHNKPVQLSA